jgi:energy-coupling factor transporter ATP-binding protein EcfA2
MKIRGIKITWFRGSADLIELDTALKSLVVYGENGSGKSSFVDAVEYNIKDGKINHLAHEYSGRKQEKAIINTHTPGSQLSSIIISFEDKSTLEAKIQKNGTFTTVPDEHHLRTWDYRRTILRQNEVADFIADTKGDKYSALLPLLGLSHLEVAAENLRKIEKNLASLGKLDAKKQDLIEINLKRNKEYGTKKWEDIKTTLLQMIAKYCSESASTKSLTLIINETAKAIKTRIDKLSEEEKRHTTLLEISRLDIASQIKEVRANAVKLSSSSEPLIVEKLTVLKAAVTYSNKNVENEIDCPACGRSIESSEFAGHVKAEEKALKEAVADFDTYKANINVLCESLYSLKKFLKQNSIEDWKTSLDYQAVNYIERLDIEGLRSSCKEEELSKIEENVGIVITAASSEVKDPLPDAASLVADKEKLEVIKEIVRGSGVSKDIKKIEDAISFISTLQRLHREQIRAKASAVIGEISSDIARMWGILHPDEKVEDVRLNLPTDIDKAIEIGLKFYGVEQGSPRLTLSEGHRNSLGLCIFLAMAKKDVGNPIILDDVVVSFDRNHRGMVGELLTKEFADRQVLLFTHERDWYIDLRRQLDSKLWQFKTLLPWESPEVGIRLSEKQFGFDDARAFLLTSPDSAGNTARKIVDTSFAVLAESLQVSLPYRHRERNDGRTGHEFLEKMAAAKDSFQIKRDGSSYESFSEALEDLKSADKLVISWANRASHDFDVTKNEAAKLIGACEVALSRFTCEKCNKEVTYLTNEKYGFKQCSCGYLRWRF